MLAGGQTTACSYAAGITMPTASLSYQREGVEAGIQSVHGSTGHVPLHGGCP